MPSKEWSPTNILDVFGDPIARATLVIASDHPVTAKELADQLDVSDPTIYRRVNPLVDTNLLQEHQRIDKNGNQPNTYETVLEEVTFTINASGYTVDIQFRQDLADDFESMWSDLEQIGQKINSTPGTQPTQSSEQEPDYP